jgi:EmrB/QacA subfamily drug resistance transporter
VFLTGLALFTLSSFACGLAPNGGLLLLARVVQGAGAACMAPASMALVINAFAPEQRGTALGVWSGVSATALALGPVIGGFLTTFATWHWVFFVNVPVGVAGILATLAFVPESRVEAGSHRLDISGVVTSVVFLVLVTLVLGETHSWDALELGVTGAVALAALVAFLMRERRAAAPMIDLALFRNSTFSGANFVGLATSLSMTSGLFFLSLYMQQVRAADAMTAGLMFMPWFVPLVVIAPVAGELTDKLGPRWLVVGGMLLMAGSFLWLSRVGVSSSLPAMMVALAVAGVGISLVGPASTTAALSSVPPAESGAAAGILNTARQVGGALGLGAVGAIQAAVTAGQLARGATSTAGFAAGIDAAFSVVAAIALVAGIVASFSIHQHRELEEQEHHHVLHVFPGHMHRRHFRWGKPYGAATPALQTN